MDHFTSWYSISKKQVEADRKKQVGARYKQTDAQINEQLNKQLADLETGTTKPIVSNIQKAEQEMMRRAEKVAKKHFAKQLKEIKALENKMHKLAVQAQLEAVLQTLSKDKQTQAKRMADLWVRNEITQADFDIYMRGLNAK
jgi:hypothetical protein